MFDKLDDMLIHYEELMRMLGDPDVTQDTKRFTKLMKEQAELAPIVEAYKQYKQAKQDVEDSLAMLEKKMTRKCVKWQRRSYPMQRNALRSWSMS